MSTDARWKLCCMIVYLAGAVMLFCVIHALVVDLTGAFSWHWRVGYTALVVMIAAGVAAPGDEEENP